MKILTSLILSTFFCSSALAQGAQEFVSLDSLEDQNSYRLTCSNIESEPQTHLYAEVSQGQLIKVQVLIVYPGLSLQVRNIPSEELSVKLSAEELKIDGSWTSEAYWPERLTLSVINNNGKLAGTASFDDGGNTQIERRVKCSALNYILSPAS